MNLKILCKKGVLFAIITLLSSPFVTPTFSAERNYTYSNQRIIPTLEDGFVDDVGWYTSLALDNDKEPHISYYDYTHGNLKYTHCTNGEWIIQVVDDTGDVGRYTSLRIDKEGHPHISYYDVTQGDLKYVFFDGDTWVNETVDRLGNVGLYTSLGLDNQSFPHIIYIDYSKRVLKYAFWTGSRWQKEIVDNSAEIGVYEYFGDQTSLVLDSQDYPHISYCDFENYDLKYAYYDGKRWMTEVIDSAGEVGQYSSLKLDKYDNPYICYGCWKTVNIAFDLKYARKENDEWIIETVDKEGDIRKWISLDLDSQQQPHISYYDYTDGALKYAFLNASSWQKYTVDSWGSTGLFNSLSLNQENQPCISYYDWGRKALKYASLADKEWVVQIIEMDTNKDLLDQEQIYCCGYANPMADNEPLAQSFTPSYRILTRVELMIVKRYNPQGLTVSIRQTLDGDDITSVYVPSSEVAEDLSWKNFDFSDIDVNPGETYYIVCTPEDTKDYDMYYWYFGVTNPYPQGYGWIKKRDWDILTSPGFPEMDLGFKTFGLDTGIPDVPVIDGPISGKVGSEYEYTFISSDPDGDNLWYIIEWDETDSVTSGPHESGEIITLTHTWLRSGDYTVRAKAIDSYGAESQWGILKVSMPKNKELNNLFQQFLEWFEDLFPMLCHYFDGAKQ